MTGTRVAFLDLDGTLIDSAPGIVACMRCAFDAVGANAPPDAVLRSWIGPPVLRTLERELGECGDDVVQAANRAFRECFDGVGAHQATPFEGIPEVLESLCSGGLVVSVVTHKPEVLAEVALAQHDLRRFVASVHAPPSPAQWVSKEDLFAEAIAASRPQWAVAAGDRAGDVRAASSHGIPSVGVLWGYGSACELDEAGAAALASAASELPALLAAHSGPLG